MSKRLRVTYELVNFNNQTKEVEFRATAADGRTATAKGPSVQVAQRAARALVEVQPVPEKAPETVRSVVPAPVQGLDLASLVAAAVAQAMAQLGHASTTPAPQATSTPTQSNTVEAKKLIAPPDKRWFQTRARVQTLCNELQRANGLDGKNYGAEVDSLMAAAGCEPVYGERSSEEKRKLAKATRPYFKAHHKALKALNAQTKAA